VLRTVLIPVPLEDKELCEETGICAWCVQMERHDD
jgi:hypothetical protein